MATTQIDERVRKMMAEWTVVLDKPVRIGSLEECSPVTVTTGTAVQFPTMLPIAVKVQAKTAAMDLVAVQPLGAPSGTLAYMDFVMPKKYKVHYVTINGDHEVVEQQASSLDEVIRNIAGIDYVKFHTTE